MKVLICSVLLSLLCTASVSAGGPLVKTKQGLIQGVQVHEKVNAFLGLPYAKPPVGELRFRPSEPLESSINDTGVRNATQFGHVCHQFRYRNVMGDNLAPTTSESEDCLTLNVFVPHSLPKSKSLPVLVWIYGGAFNEGSSSAPAYDPTGLVTEQQRMIVVTLNYRLNLFGFPNSPALPHEEQNLGIRDQRRALEWLRENLAAFGGDPDQITMGGQSAGADSAAALTYTYKDDPIARALILQSGIPEYIGPQDDTVFVRVAETVGCRDSRNRAYELHCMRKIEAKSLRDAMSNHTLNSFGTTGGAPMVDNITVFTVQDYLKLGAAGNFSRLPVLMGILDSEGDSVLNFSEEGGVNRTLSDILTTTFFNCPMAQEALFRVRHNVPVWRYRYMGVFPSVTFYPWLGAYHLADIPIALASYTGLVPHKEPEAKEIAASKYLGAAWAAFISSPTEGLTKEMGWPTFSPNDTTLITLFPDNSPNATLQDPSEYDAICANPPPIPPDFYSWPPPDG